MPPQAPKRNSHLGSLHKQVPYWRIAPERPPLPAGCQNIA